MMKFSRRASRLAIISTAAAAAFSSMIISPAFGVADSHAGKTWAQVTMKAGPAPRFNSVGTIAKDTGVEILCQTPGVSMTGHKGTSNIWDMIARGVFIPDVNVADDAPTGYVTEKCTYVGAPARDNPRTTDGAISYEFSQLGSTKWEGDCLVLARTAYGWSSSGWATAEIGGDWFANHGTLNTTGIPPRGALVWYHNSAGTGHVTISLGEGLVIGSSVNGKVGVSGYKDHGMYRGWSKPNFPLAS